MVCREMINLFNSYLGQKIFWKLYMNAKHSFYLFSCIASQKSLHRKNLMWLLRMWLCATDALYILSITYCMFYKCVRLPKKKHVHAKGESWPEHDNDILYWDKYKLYPFILSVYLKICTKLVSKEKDLFI